MFSVTRRLSRAFSKAGEILTGVGPTPTKQFKNAILDGDEERAIELYTCTEGEKYLCDELHPSKPFPSKKQSSAETPLHLTAKFGLLKLLVILLHRGGDPTALNENMETCLHSVCSQGGSPEVRAAIMEILLVWQGSQEKGHVEEKVSLNRANADGNTAVHLAATHGLLSCVEKLVGMGSIISIVNRGNLTCAELAAEKDHLQLALMLELALVFQPVDEQLASLVTFPYDGSPGLLLLNSSSLGSAGVDAFIEECVDMVVAVLAVGLRAQEKAAPATGEEAVGKQAAEPASTVVEIGAGVVTLGDPFSDMYRARAEALLATYSWNVAELICALREDPAKALQKARLEPLQLKSPPAPAEAEMKVAGSSVLAPFKDFTATFGAKAKKTDSSIDEAQVGRLVAEVVDEIVAQVLADGQGEGGKTGELTLDLSDIMLSAEEQGADDLWKVVAEAEVGVGVGAGAGADACTDLTPTGGPCVVCGDALLCPVEAHYFGAGLAEGGAVLQPGRRAISCNSGHVFCGDCWAGHLTVQVADNGAGSLLCMGFKCGETLDLRWAPVLLDAQMQARFRAQRQRRVVDCCPALKACPVANCGVTVALTLGSTAAEGGDCWSASQLPCCSLCKNGHVFCLQCNQEAHAPCNCEQVNEWNKQVGEQMQTAGLPGSKGKGGEETSVSSDVLANALWVAANTKRCPRCKTPIEKDEGCNHMSCRNCRKEFCWICMQDWTLHSDRTGGYFQCNRFVQAGGVVGAVGGEGEGDGDIWSEEKGNAHAETLRLRWRNQKMARFIHHFTRYQAHRESVGMEGRMYQATLLRIRGGLVASAEGKLHWLQGEVSPNPMASHNVKSAAQPSLASEALPAQGPGESGVKSQSDEEDFFQMNPLVAQQVLASSTSVGSGSGTTSAPATSAGVDAGTNVAGESDVWEESEECLRFLTDGFDELLKCRNILQWSYPYAYFEFENEDDHDYTSMRPSANRSRGRFGRAVNEDHHRIFDLLQADLEGNVETLSDVVARRRLRAGRDQIALATRAASSKRIEIETVIVTFAATRRRAKRVAGAGMHTPSARAQPQRPRTADYGYHRSRQVRRQQELTAQTERRPRLRSDSEETVELDVAALLFELDLASSQEVSAVGNAGGAQSVEMLEVLSNRQQRLELLQQRMRAIFGGDLPTDNATASASNLEFGSGAHSARARALNESVRRQTLNGTSSRRRNRGNSNDNRARRRTINATTPSTSPIAVRQVRNSPLNINRELSVDPDFLVSSDEDDTEGEGAQGNDGADSGSYSNSGSEEQEEVARPTHAQTLFTATRLRQILRRGNADEINAASDALRTMQLTADPSPTRVHRLPPPDIVRDSMRDTMRLEMLTQRAEEEAALNRAILMSLQESHSTNTNTTTGAQEGEASVPSTESIGMLQGMGFTQEQASQALVESRGDVSLAANRLLGIN